MQFFQYGLDHLASARLGDFVVRVVMGMMMARHIGEARHLDGEFLDHEEKGP